MSNFSKFFNESETNKSFSPEINEEDQRQLSILKRRLNAFRNKKSEKSGHILSNTLIEYINTYDHQTLINVLNKEFDQSRSSVLFTFLKEIVEDIEITDEQADSKLAKKVIEKLKKDRKLDIR